MERCFGLVERFTVMVRVVGFLEACERVSYGKTHEVASDAFCDLGTATKSVHLVGIWPAITPNNQWYSMLGCSMGTWL